MRRSDFTLTRRSILAGALVSSSACALLNWDRALAQTAVADKVRAGFDAPPNAARPRVWWRWMNGNVTLDGIRKDLEWMKRVGIGGLQNFDASLATPQIVDKRLIYMTPEWKQAFRLTTELAEKLDLELAIAASPGWSETGGPWVPPQDGLKKLVWSETIVQGGRPFSGALSVPPGSTGPFQDMEMGLGIGESEVKAAPDFFKDAYVLAFPVSGSNAPPRPKATFIDGQPVDAAVLFDGSYRTTLKRSFELLGRFNLLPNCQSQQPIFLRHCVCRTDTSASSKLSPSLKGLSSGKFDRTTPRWTSGLS